MPTDCAYPRPWQPGSTLDRGPRNTLTHGAKALWLARLDTLRRARHITHAHVAIARDILSRLGLEGLICPSHETIARSTDTSERTVRRALARLREVGLLRWTRRLRRRAGTWSVEQTSNAYEVLVPAEWEMPPPPIRAPRSGGQIARQAKERESITDAEWAELSLAAAIAQARNARAWLEAMEGSGERCLKEA